MLDCTGQSTDEFSLDWLSERVTGETETIIINLEQAKIMSTYSPGYGHQLIWGHFRGARIWVAVESRPR